MNENTIKAIRAEIETKTREAKVLRALAAALREFPADRKQTLRETKKINQFLSARGIENASVSFCGSEWVPEIKVVYGPNYPWRSVSIDIPKRPDGEEHLHRAIYPFHPNTADKAESDAINSELAANGREVILQNINQKIEAAELIYTQAMDAVRGFQAAIADIPWEAREILFSETRFREGKELDKIYTK